MAQRSSNDLLKYWNYDRLIIQVPLVIDDITELYTLTGGSGDNYYTTGATLSGNVISFNRNDLINVYSVDLTPVLTGGTGVDTYVTGFTWNGGTSVLTIKQNEGQPDLTATLTGLSGTDNYTTGATLNGAIIEFNRTDLSNAYSVDLSGIVEDIGIATGTTSTTGSTTLIAVTGLTNEVTLIEALVSGYNTSTYQTIGIKMFGTFVTSGGTTTLIGSLSKETKTNFDYPYLLPTATLTPGSGSISLDVTGISATTINWNTKLNIF